MMKHIVYSDAVSFEDRNSAATDALKEKAKKEADEKAKTDGQKQWKVAKVAKDTRGPPEPASMSMEQLLEQAAMEAAAVKLQASVRGRRVRVRNRAMSKEEGDKIWYGQIKPVIKQVFDDISGGDGDMDMQEFVQWLNEEWRHQKQLSKGIDVPGYWDDDDDDSFIKKDAQKTDEGDDKSDEGGDEAEQPQEKPQEKPAVPSLDDLAITTQQEEKAYPEHGKHDGVYKDEFFSTFYKELKRAGRLEEMDDADADEGGLTSASSSPERRPRSARSTPSLSPEKRRSWNGSPVMLKKPSPQHASFGSRPSTAAPTPSQNGLIMSSPLRSAPRPSTASRFSEHHGQLTVTVAGSDFSSSASPSPSLSPNSLYPPPMTIPIPTSPGFSSSPGTFRQSRLTRLSAEPAGVLPQLSMQLSPSKSERYASPRSLAIRKSVMGLSEAIAPHVQALSPIGHRRPTSSWS